MLPDTREDHNAALNRAGVAWLPCDDSELVTPGTRYRSTVYLDGPGEVLAQRVPLLRKPIADHYAKSGATIDSVTVGTPRLMPRPRTGKMVSATPMVIEWHVAPRATLAAGVSPTPVFVAGAIFAGEGLSWPVTLLVLGTVGILAAAVAFSVVGTTVEKHGYALEHAIESTATAGAKIADAAGDTVFNPSLWLIVGVVALVWLRR